MHIIIIVFQFDVTHVCAAFSGKLLMYTYVRNSSYVWSTSDMAIKFENLFRL